MSFLAESGSGSAAHSTAGPRIVILGCGNPSRGDDALGPVLVELARQWVRSHPGAPVSVVEDFQFQVEHCLDLEGQDLALFVDAAASGPEPFSLVRIQPARDATFSTHAVSPQAVLHAFGALECGAPPPAFMLAIRGNSFELGEDLSAAALNNLEAAWGLLEQCLERPSIGFWESRCTMSLQS